MAKALPIRHIGLMQAICDRRRTADLRTDLGADRYRQLGVKERFVGEAPYRVCPACIKALPFQYLPRKRRRVDRKAEGK